MSKPVTVAPSVTILCEVKRKRVARRIDMEFRYIRAVCLKQLVAVGATGAKVQLATKSSQLPRARTVDAGSNVRDFVDREFYSQRRRVRHRQQRYGNDIR